MKKLTDEQIDALSKEDASKKIKELQRDLERQASYGLVWDREKEPERVVLECQSKIPLLKREESKDVIKGNIDNVLIEGDNFHALNSLGMVLRSDNDEGVFDVIYIDPPYNTGNEDFTYNDKVIDENDKYRDSKWLNSIEKRLKMAIDFLKPTGVIFISIDDNEQANLKLLCDSIFGVDNMVAQMIVASNSTKNNANLVSVSHEYLLCYAKNISLLQTAKWQVKKNNIDEFQKRVNQLLKSGLNYDQIHNELLQLTKYPRFYDFDHYTYADKDGVYQTDNPGGVKNGNFQTEIEHPKTHKNCAKPEGGWRYSDDEIKAMLKRNEWEFGEDETIVPRPKRYLKDYLTQIPKSILFFDSQSSTKWMKKHGFDFDFPKSTDFIEYILSIFGKDAMILDFYAGSGTTAHAAMNLNKEDGGTRRVFLCTNNEVSFDKENEYLASHGLLEKAPTQRKGDAFRVWLKKRNSLDRSYRLNEDYQSLGICRSVCYPRIKSVIEGKDLQGNPTGDSIAENLFYFKTDFLDMNEQGRDKSPDDLKTELSEKCATLLSIKEDCLIQKESEKGFVSFSNIEDTKRIFVFFALDAQEQISEKRDLLEKYPGKKIIYQFSFDDLVDEDLIQGLKNCEIKPIPTKMLQRYKDTIKRMEAK